MKNFKTSSKQQGFTMTELLIVVVILGILGFVVMRALSGNTDNAQATAIRSTANELAKGMGYIHANLGNGLSPTNNPITRDSMNMLDVLVSGESAVKQTFEERYIRLGMRPLSSDIRKDTDGYYIFSSKVELIECNGTSRNRKVCSTFTNVSRPVAEAIAAKEGQTINSGNPGQDTVHIDAGTNGFHTVTFAIVP